MRPNLYFIRGVPAGDVPPPEGGYETFGEGSACKEEIVSILVNHYADSILQEEEIKPHVFFNEHNQVCRVIHHRHFPAKFKKALEEARTRILERDDDSISSVSDSLLLCL